MQFDFAGDNLWIVDKDTGEAIRAIVLVCVLPYSMLSYVTAFDLAHVPGHWKDEPVALRHRSVEVVRPQMVLTVTVSAAFSVRSSAAF